MNFWDIYWLVLVCAMGLSFGSFLNVCIYRIPLELSLSHPPSTCPKCNTRIKWYDNVPVFGWIFLGGKCRACKAPISVGYPVIELLFGLTCLELWLLYGISYAQPFVAISYGLLAFGLLLGTFIDLAEMWLPDRVTIGGMIAGPLLSLLVPALHGADGWLGGLTASLIGLAAGYGSFWLIRAIGTAALKKEAMGLGDVKLMGALGAFLGWQACVLVFFMAPLAGLAIKLFTLFREREFPYGPYLCLASVVLIVCWSPIWNWVYPTFESGWLVALLGLFCLVMMPLLLMMCRVVRGAFEK